MRDKYDLYESLEGFLDESDSMVYDSLEAGTTRLQTLDPQSDSPVELLQLARESIRITMNDNVRDRVQHTINKEIDIAFLSINNGVRIQYFSQARDHLLRDIGFTIP